METVEPAGEFGAPVLIIAPHMDDEVLACGGLIAMLPWQERVHVVLATDGTKSPSPVIPFLDPATPSLSAIRMDESRAALTSLGITEENIHFLGLPEARLRRQQTALQERLLYHVQAIRPESILIPFRYDRHPDHLAVNHAVMAAERQGRLSSARLYEYFVYYRWRLLPGRDVRRYINAEYLFAVDTADVAAQKRAALDYYTSQTTKFASWQTRPILTPSLLDEVSYQPEVFLRYDPAVAGAAVFDRSVAWIRLVHRVEPTLKKWRYLSGAILQRAVGNHG